MCESGVSRAQNWESSVDGDGFLILSIDLDIIALIIASSRDPDSPKFDVINFQGENKDKYENMKTDTQKELAFVVIFYKLDHLR